MYMILYMISYKCKVQKQYPYLIPKCRMIYNIFHDIIFDIMRDTMYAIMYDITKQNIIHDIIVDWPI